MSTLFLLSALTNPLGQNLFCQFYNNGEVPMPPVGTEYFITEDLSDFFITENGLYNFITE